jgi:pimeloyl-ACP methyl ester carboxylesterase
MPILDVGSARLYYQADGADGPPIAFLNGWTASSRMWAPLVKILRASYFCVRFDPRGTGRSLATSFDAGFEIDDAVDDLHALLRATGVRDVHLVGHGVGALTAAVAAHRRPQDFSSLTLIGPEYVPLSTTEAAAEAEENALLLTQTRLLLQEVATMPIVRNFLLWRYRRTPEPYRTQLFEDFSAADPRAAYLTMRSALDSFTRKQFEDAVSGVSLPVLLMRGEYDDVASARVMRGLFARIRRGQSALVRGGGHVPMLEYPKECAGLLDEFFRTEAPIRHRIAP